MAAGPGTLCGRKGTCRIAVLGPLCAQRDAALRRLRSRAVGRGWDKLARASARGESVNAKVVAATGAGVYVRVAGVPAFIRRRELKWRDSARPTECIGLRFAVAVTVADQESGHLELSARKLARQRCTTAQATDRRVAGVVVRANQGGLVIDVDGFRGFLPRSLMTNRQQRRYRSLVGRRWRGYVASVRRFDAILSSVKAA